MATAGRILIMPRGRYESTTSYAPLDMVLHNGNSWLCKQNATGVEPSDDNSEYWYRVTEQSEDLDRIISELAEQVEKCIKGEDVVDNLSSTSANLPLSANQGRLLGEAMGGLSFVALTQEEYDALSTKDEFTIYFIKES